MRPGSAARCVVHVSVHVDFQVGIIVVAAADDLDFADEVLLPVGSLVPPAPRNHVELAVPIDVHHGG
ncbi:MAG: hypothetical protein B7Z55_19720 [Planctomycetales bacterium 12-60-4]|nr:MAG: hypothetical protein B7Z55_19720 [Planctomycetales bacterium 12-60-4]